VSFKLAVTDNEQFKFTVNSVTKATTNSSGFAAADAGGSETSTSGDHNRIEVTATDLIFDQQTSSISTSVAMNPAPTVQAVDIITNLDLDFTDNFTVSVTTGSTTFDGTATTTGNFTSGIATLNNLIFNTAATGNKLTITSGSFTEESSAFDVTNPLPEINIKQGATNLSSGGNYDFGNLVSGNSSTVTTFTIENIGAATLNLSGTPIVAISGTNASEFSVDYTSTTTTVNAAGSTTFTITFSPTTKGLKSAQISITNDDTTGSENPYIINLTGNSTASNSSNIVATTGYSYTDNIDYINFQTVNSLTTANAVGVFGLTLQDGGGTTDTDNLNTTLTDISISTGGFAGIRTAALFDGSTNLKEISVNGVTTLSFTGLNISATDNGSKSFILYVTFLTSVTDNTSITYTVTSATADTNTSNFATANAGGAVSSVSGNINKIEVTATQLAFVQQPTNTVINADMSPAVTVKGVDSNNNLDLDFVAGVDITSTGTLNTTPQTSNAIAGIATFSTIKHTALGTGFTLTSQSTGLTQATSGTFNIVIQPAGLLLFEENFEYTAVDNLTSHGWFAHSSGGTNPIQVHTSGLTYSNYGSTGLGNAALVDNSGEDVNRTFTEQSVGSTIYASFLVNVASLNTSIAGYLVHFGPTAIGTDFRCRFFIKESSGNLKFGVAGYNGTENYSVNNYSFNTTYLIVLKYTFDATNSTASIFINPSVYSEPSIPDATHTQTTTNTNIGSIALRQFHASQNVVVDGIRVATNWGTALGNPQYDSSSTINGNNYNTVEVLGADTLTTNGDVTIHKSLEMQDTGSTLSVPTGSTFTVKNGAFAQVDGSINNSGTITIEDDASLVQNGTTDTNVNSGTG
jgi:phosphotransferase system IIB component